MGQGAPEVTSLCTYSTEPVTYTTFNKQNTQLYFIRNGVEPQTTTQQKHLSITNKIKRTASKREKKSLCL